MAYIRKLKTGWRAEVERKGVRKSHMFTTKAEAQLWAAAEETAIVKESRQTYPSKTLADAIDRYVSDVSVHKRGSHAEELRFNAIKREFPALCGKLIWQVTPSDIAEWRDARRKRVSDSSVVRDRLLIRDLHFHDSRADALTRLSKRMDVMKLAKISGHRDLNQLLDAYYRETAADIAASI